MNDVMTHNRMTTYKMRSFMESFAKSRHMDPLTPDTWYNITTADLLPLKVLFSSFLLFLLCFPPFTFY